ncbi:MAG TPA: hypothetical protein VE566_01155 [Nitrososphaeraceae archaeon]|nr:hypothetical protein [Nitrososphaeraceae archaeon]
MKFYRLNPVTASRLQISASYIRELMYAQASEGKIRMPRTETQKGKHKWSEHVPSEVLQIIEDNWAVVSKFASCPDKTMKLMGMKFPSQGFL